MSLPVPDPTPPKPPLWKTEPVAVFGAIQTVLAALLGVLVAFDVWDPDSEQIAALGGLWAAVTAVVTMYIRSQVVPDVNVALTHQDVSDIRAIQAAE